VSTLLKIPVIDGQGGGIGSVVIKRIKETYGEPVEIWGLRINAIAASKMLKAGANRGAAEENAICYCAQHTDITGEERGEVSKGAKSRFGFYKKGWHAFSLWLARCAWNIQAPGIMS
jgi:hypothetical protein